SYRGKSVERRGAHLVVVQINIHLNLQEGSLHVIILIVIVRTIKYHSRSPDRYSRNWSRDRSPYYDRKGSPDRSPRRNSDRKARESFKLTRRHSRSSSPGKIFSHLGIGAQHDFQNMKRTLPIMMI
ncbi:hypothetical protein CEXT_522101, partial [Caerostris extrusa]